MATKNWLFVITCDYWEVNGNTLLSLLTSSSGDSQNLQEA